MAALDIPATIKEPVNEPRRDGRPTGLILADPHPVTLAGIRHLVESELDAQVLVDCVNATETLAAVAQHPAATLVIDLHLPPDGALPLIRQLTGHHLGPTVLLASQISHQETFDALRAGVRGVALKQLAPAVIIECIRSVAGGETWIENVTFASVMERAIQSDARKQDLRRLLTRRELHILTLVGEGLSNKEITERLRIAEGTVKIHLNHIYRKVGVKDRAQLAQCARLAR